MEALPLEVALASGAGMATNKVARSVLNVAQRKPEECSNGIQAEGETDLTAVQSIQRDSAPRSRYAL